MAVTPLVDIEALIHVLRLGVGYASRTGLLLDREVLGVVKVAEVALQNEDRASLDLEALTKALNEVARVILPMTVADLTFGRDPFSTENQTRSKLLQLGLSIIACILLVTVGYFMHSR